MEPALTAVQRLSHRQFDGAAELPIGGNYKVALRFRLDLSQLPLPFQIGTFGQSEWDLAAFVTVPLTLNPAK